MLIAEAFRFTTAELAFAVPAGVIVGGIVTGLAGYFGSKAAGRGAVQAQIEAGKLARTLAFDQRLYEQRTAVFRPLLNEIVTFSIRADEKPAIFQLERYVVENAGAFNLVTNSKLRERYRLFGRAVSACRIETEWDTPDIVFSEKLTRARTAVRSRCIQILVGEWEARGPKRDFLRDRSPRTRDAIYQVVLLGETLTTEIINFHQSAATNPNS